MKLDLNTAKILVTNLMSRIVTLEDGSKQLPGVLTAHEIEALTILLGLDALPKAHPPNSIAPSEAEPEKSPQAERPYLLKETVMTLPKAAENIRVCLDFGTAMSKASLIKEDEEAEFEEIEILHLGIPGDQEEISETMLISSVYIDNEGVIWFGNKAREKSLLENSTGNRQRLDNIKRRLSEDGLENKVGIPFNPTDIYITYSDMVLAYLTFFTWTVNECLEDLGYPSNTNRRFAMPCFEKEKESEITYTLRNLLGKAQILADTFSAEINSGLPLTKFAAALKAFKDKKYNYEFVLDSITEPLGVASSLISWKQHVNMLVMTIDVGAGTSDFSLNRIHINPDTGSNTAAEVKDSAVGITEAGNYLDNVLVEVILKKGGVDSTNPEWINIRGELNLSIRDYKESLFLDGEVYIALSRFDIEVQITLAEFLEQDAVKKFGSSLRNKMQEILEKIDISFIEWVRSHPQRRLVVALTGGGAELPMVKELAEGHISVNGLAVQLAPSLRFPSWLENDYPDLEEDYPRIAVSLGGARKRMIKRNSALNITAGNMPVNPQLDRFPITG